jgi:hypothetical protein
MNRYLHAPSLAALTLAVLAGLCMAPVAEAARGGGHGGGGHGGGQRAAGGGGHKVQASNVHADRRTNNVRNTSVNNINVDRNVNVDVDVDRHGGWDNDYHPVATAAAVTAAVGVTSAVVGSIVRSVPPTCVPVSYGGYVYQQCGGTWYQAQGPQYIVVNPPY